MAKKSKFQINLEYAALKFACLVVNLVPYERAMKIADSLGRFLVLKIGLHRKRTEERIRSVFPEKSSEEVTKIAIQSLQNLLKNIIEMIRAPKLTREWMDKYVQDGLKYKEKLQSYVDEGNGVVIMVPHSGNWYMAAWSMAKYGLPLFAIAAKQRNPKITAWMNSMYRDIEVLERDERDTLVKIKKNLKAGRAFAILPDLRVPKKDVEVDFLNGTANVSRAGAMFAIKCNCPIVVAIMSRQNGKHVFNHLATLRPEGKTAEELTAETIALLDKEIKKRPGDWFWYNKRWILQPVKTEEMK